MEPNLVGLNGKFGGVAGTVVGPEREIEKGKKDSMDL